MLGQLIGGRYKIVQHLGGGGFGQTYLAEDRHRSTQFLCAIKHLKPQVSDPAATRFAKRLFEREAEVLERLGNHNRIPKLFGYFEENQEFYLVQEFIEGRDLKQELRRQGQFSEAQVASLLHETLGILELRINPAYS